MSVEAIRHELELSVRRDEGDGAVVLKAGQTDALVELDILQLYRFALPTYMNKAKQVKPFSNELLVPHVKRVRPSLNTIRWCLYRRELTSSVFKQNLVIEAQTQLRHSREENTHLDGTHDLTAQDIAIGTNLKNEGISRVSGETRRKVLVTTTGHRK